MLACFGLYQIIFIPDKEYLRKLSFRAFASH
jgi:hypothetical protein